MRNPAAETRRHRRRASLWAAAGAALATVVLSGCGDTAAVVDAGATVSAPPLPVPLWSVAAEPSGSPSPLASPPDQPEPLPGVSLPPGGDLRSLSAQEIIAKDPNVTPDLQRAAADCLPGSGCGLRRPELRDLTGDGRPELLVLIDPDPRHTADTDTGLPLDTQLYVYWADGGRVFQVHADSLGKGTQVDLQERDLVIRRIADPWGWPGSTSQLTTDRYRWNSQLHQLELHSSVVAPMSTTAPSKAAPKTP
ncbi:hypothetical protein [Streptomyces sp. HUAS TT7]|uniref:hypothetical protein n=1 Tax=Streptomyces sp. HUAS TT7 TaxID=3447507 RepID=UPI003F65F73E